MSLTKAMAGHDLQLWKQDTNSAPASAAAPTGGELAIVWNALPRLTSILDHRLTVSREQNYNRDHCTKVKETIEPRALCDCTQSMLGAQKESVHENDLERGS
jgi:hypothetical protein